MMRRMMRFISGFLSIVMLIYMMELPVYATGMNETANKPVAETESNSGVAELESKETSDNDSLPEAHILMELDDRREENVKHFLMSDHTVQALVYEQPISVCYRAN